MATGMDLALSEGGQPQWRGCLSLSCWGSYLLTTSFTLGLDLGSFKRGISKAVFTIGSPISLASCSVHTV